MHRCTGVRSLHLTIVRSRFPDCESQRAAPSVRMDAVMKKVFSSGRVVDCDRVRLALAARGITSELRNEASATLGGLSLPVGGSASSGLAQGELWVKEEDVEEAVAVLAELTGEGEHCAQAPSPRRRGRPFLVGLLTGIAFASAAFFGHRHWVQTRSGIAELDQDKDGHVETWYHYDRGRITLVEQDRNGDGKVDTRFTYEDEKIRRISADVDHNGEPDVTTLVSNGLEVASDWRPNGSQIVLRRDLFIEGRIGQALVDTNQDGTFDLRLTYDLVGNVTQTIDLAAQAPR